MVKFIQSPSGEPYNLAYFVGDTAEFESDLETELIAQGVAIPASEAEKEAYKKETAESKKAEKAEKR